MSCCGNEQQAHSQMQNLQTNWNVSWVLERKQLVYFPVWKHKDNTRIKAKAFLTPKCVSPQVLGHSLLIENGCIWMEQGRLSATRPRWQREWEWNKEIRNLRPARPKTEEEMWCKKVAFSQLCSLPIWRSEKRSETTKCDGKIGIKKPGIPGKICPFPRSAQSTFTDC